VYVALAQPAFGLALLGGVGALSENTRAYMHMHWMHGKLAAVVVLIALHHILGAKARRAASGGMQAGRNGGTLTGVLLVCALAIVTLVMYRDALVP
jgi:putative membrane protein